LEYWSIGVLEYWSIGVLEYWSVGVLVSWRLECRSGGVMEDLDHGRAAQAMGRIPSQKRIFLLNFEPLHSRTQHSTPPETQYSTAPFIHQSITPIFQYPDTPSLQYSIAPILDCFTLLNS
jgi:hypothetical protein